MSTVVKLGIAAAFAGLVYLGWNKGKALISAFTFDISKYGVPQIKNSILYVPVYVHFKNPSTIPLNIDQLYADIFLFKGNQFQKVGQVSQPLTIPPGESDQVIMPMVKLSDLFGGNIFSTLQNIFATRKVSIRTDVTITYAGVTLPTQSFTNDIDLPSA